MLKIPVFINKHVVTSAALWCCGDVIAQHIEHQKHKCKQSNKTLTLNHRRSAGTFAFGAMFVAPLGQQWYRFLDTSLTTICKFNRPYVISSKIAMESLIWNPTLTATYFLWMSFLNRHSIEQVKATFKNTYLSTVFVETTYWPVFDLINFTFVPVHHQLLFVNTVSLLDTAFVSWKYSMCE